MRKECILEVVSNLQTISSRDRKRKSITTYILILALTAALFLTGVTPSFADAKNEKTENAAGPAEKVQNAVKIDWSDAPETAGTSVIVMEADSGKIIYEENPHERRSPASITKIMTCLVVLETTELDQKVTVDYPVNQEEINMGLKQGEVLTIKDLLYSMMILSANDAAEMLAVEVGGSIENFSQMMNKRAKECGAENTVFTNPSGLGGGDHKSTAYDIALMAREAMTNDEFRKIVSAEKYTVPATNKSDERTYKTTNMCLKSKKKVKIDGKERPMEYEGTIGVKTGYTKAAGECYCGWANQDNMDLIVVTLNAEEKADKFVDAIRLWDYGFGKYDTYTAAKGHTAVDEVWIRYGEDAKVPVYLERDLDVLVRNGADTSEYSSKIIPDDAKAAAPLKKGDKVATMVVYKGEKAVAEADLLAMESVRKGGTLATVRTWIVFDMKPYLIAAAAVLIAGAAARIIYIRSRKNKMIRNKAQRFRKIRRKEREKERNPFGN